MPTLTRKRGSSATKPSITPQWQRLLRRIPGYDPIATAGACTFDAQCASDALDFFATCLRHVKGELAGQFFLLEPWQQAILANLWGWKRPDGTRRYRECLLYVPRKNGKTAFAAGIVLLSLFTDHEAGAEIYGAAADRDQATLVYEHAKGMVLAEPELEKRGKIYIVAKSIVYEERGSSYKVISAEANTKHGYNSHMVVIDELHAQPDRELVDVLMTSTGARKQPLILHVTTADYERPSICNEKYDYACKVRDGIIEDSSFLPVIYEAQLTDDWTSPKVWAKANPNLGISLSEEYLQRECQRAKEVPSYLNTFLRLHLNVKTEQDVRWLDMAQWDACATPFEEGPLVRQRCFAGLDLASTSDLCALALYFPETQQVLMRFWLPEETAKLRERRARVPYLTWARQGALTLTGGNVADYAQIRQDIDALCTQYKVVELAYDRWNASQLITELQDDGLTCVGFGQGFASMSAPAKELERLVIAGTLQHGGHPVLRWNASNVMVEGDAAGNIKPSKKKSHEKIDGIVALCMAIGRAMAQESQGPSVYETRGVLRV